MKVLPRREAISLEQKEQERMVQQGTKAARDVEAFREMRAQEEKNLNVFRENALGAVKDEIAKLTGELEGVQLAHAQEKREWEDFIKSKHEPYDKQWALYMKVEKGKIEEEKSRLESESNSLDAQKRQVDLNAERIKENGVALKQEKVKLIQLQRLAEQDREEAVETLQEAKAQSEEILEVARIREKESLDLQAQTTLEQTRVERRNEELNQKEALLEERETQVLMKELLYYSPVKKVEHG